MTETSIVPATLEHADLLAPLLRKEDVAEGEALGLKPLEALRQGLMDSEVSWAFLINGEVAALFGVVPMGRTALGYSNHGVVWMLSGRAVSKHPKAFLKASRAVVPFLLGRYQFLMNAIDARYTGALRWAKWMGFDVLPPMPMGPHGMPFCPFSISRRQ